MSKVSLVVPMAGRGSRFLMVVLVNWMETPPVVTTLFRVSQSVRRYRAAPVRGFSTVGLMLALFAFAWIICRMNG